MKAKLVFFEIPAENFDRAVKFYRESLGFNIEVCDCGEEKMGMIETEGMMGSISFAKDFKPSDNGTLVTFGVDDIDLYLKSIERNGGKTVRGKTKIEAEGMGFFALFSDSEGNKLGLYSDN